METVWNGKSFINLWMNGRSVSSLWLEWSVLNLRSWNCFTIGTFTLKGSFGSCSSQLVPVAFSLAFPSRGWRLHLLLELTGFLYHADRRAWCSMVRLDYHEGKCSQNATVAISSTWPQRLPQGLLLLVNHFIAAAWYLVGSIVWSTNWLDVPGLHGGWGPRVWQLPSSLAL